PRLSVQQRIDGRQMPIETYVHDAAAHRRDRAEVWRSGFATHISRRFFTSSDNLARLTQFAGALSLLTCIFFRFPIADFQKVFAPYADVLRALDQLVPEQLLQVLVVVLPRERFRDDWWN